MQIYVFLRSDLLWLNIYPDKNPVKNSYLVPALHVRAVRGQQAEYTVLYSHGNAEDIGYEQSFVREMAKLTNMDFFSYEYPGYSLSRYTSENRSKQVSTSEGNVNRAAEAAWRYLVNEAGVPANRIIMFGRSIGSGPTVHIASQKSMFGVSAGKQPQFAAGVFLISPILSTVRAVCNPCCAITCFCFDMFPNHKKILHVGAPVAIMHSLDDEVVKVYNGQKLASMLSENMEFSPLWMETGGHNEIDPDIILDQFLKFVAFLKEREAPQQMEENQVENYPPTLCEKPALHDFRNGFVA